jgi:hypothetical protein
MTTELVLLGTAGAPMPVAGRGGISSALIVNPWGTRVSDNGPLAPIRVYGPPDPKPYPPVMATSVVRRRSIRNYPPPARRTWSTTSASAGKPPRAATACAERSLAFVRGIEVT